MYRLCLYLSVALAVLLSASFVSADGVCTGYPKMYNGKPCASTTRYWDGTMGACGCGTGNDSPFSWVWNKPTAAASAPIYGSGTWCGSGCGKCFKLTPTAIGASPAGTGAPSLTPLVVKVSNLCPYSGNEEWCAYDVNKHDYDAHFDLMDHDMSGIISSMGWNNPEVTYEEVDCAENGYTEWNCQCASGGATSGTATEAPATKAPTTAAPATKAPATAAPATKAPATAAPTAAPTTAAPKTVAPTAAPTTVAPTAAPTTAAPKTMAPTEKPTAAPTTVAPTVPATKAATSAPTKAATSAPTKAATAAPTAVPTVAPTAVPTRRSSAAPARPSHAATTAPTKAATAAPTEAVTEAPTEAATEAATEAPVATEAATQAPAVTEAATEVPAATATEQPPATGVDSIKIEMNGGSNAWWVGFSVVNPTGNIAYVDVKDNDGSVPTWTRLTYQGDEYWNMYSLNAPEQMKAPLSLRITGVDGKVVIANNIISSFQSATVDTGVSL